MPTHTRSPQPQQRSTNYVGKVSLPIFHEPASFRDAGIDRAIAAFALAHGCLPAFGSKAKNRASIGFVRAKIRQAEFAGRYQVVDCVAVAVVESLDCFRA
jgi:hypothetical protein